MFLRFPKVWNWEISSADTDTIPYVSTFCQVMTMEISARGKWYWPLCFYILPSYETGKSVRQITDTVPYVSTFCQVMKLGNQCSRWLILSLMFLHFPKLWIWEISAADNWYCPLCFYILPSYETRKSVRQITDTVPYVSTFCQVMKLRNQCSRWLILSLMFLHFAKLLNWEISAADNWYCPLCFYILPSYETGNQCSR